MAGRGTFKAIAESDLERWLANALEDRARWDAMADVPFAFYQGVDKAWRDIHRCLTDGTLDNFGETAYPLCDAVLGEELICETDGEDYIYLKRPTAVADIAAALRPLDRAWFRSCHAEVREAEFGFDYVWGWFKPMRRIYRRAASQGLAVVFCWG